MWVFSHLRCCLFTTWNILLNAVTLNRFVWLEGRVRRGWFRNWVRGFRYRPARVASPADEQELARVISSSERLRVFGAGHSFNSGVQVEGTLVSLDAHSGVVQRHPASAQLTVRGGTRIRDVVRALLEEGLAFAALPSHDAQSIAGILSTDVHGTGRDWGFVSEAVTRMKVIDAGGTVRECTPTDDLFRAAIGGVGAAGVISEVTVQGVPRFRVEQRVYMTRLAEVEREWTALMRGNEHLSLYLFPFTDWCQVNTWNRTPRRRSRFGRLREFLSISLDALTAVWLGNALAYLRLLPWLAGLAHRLKPPTDLVLESNEAYNRTIYHLHQELEFTVPFEDAFAVCRRCLDLFEEMYRDGTRLPYTLVEVRFTPEGHRRTLIGAGRERRSAWIDLICCDSSGFETYYAKAEELVRQVGGRPHLGKYCESLDREDLARVHGEAFERFLQVVRTQDPQGRFANDFTRRLFGHPEETAADRRVGAP